MRLLGATGSHVGNVREANQDRVFFRGMVAALADGMGGHQGGERAAELAIGEFSHADQDLSETDLVELVLQANREVHDHAADNGLPGMGTTVVAMTLHGDNTITVANVGDSRAYWLRGDYMGQVTEDHSFVEDLVRQGRLTPQEAENHPQRNILTRAVGIGAEVEVDRFPIPEPEVGDRFLLCSDGLFNELSEDEILDILLDTGDPALTAAALIEATLRTPCRDNVTVAVVDLVEDSDPRLAAQAAEEESSQVVNAPMPQELSKSVLHQPGNGEAPVEDDGSDQDAVASGQTPVGGLPGQAAGTATLLRQDTGDVDVDPEAFRDTAELEVTEDDEVAGLDFSGDLDGQYNPGSRSVNGAKPGSLSVVQPRSKLLLRLGAAALILAAGVAGYFGAQAYAQSGSTYVEANDAGQLVIFEGRRNGFLGFAPRESDVTDVMLDDLTAEQQLRLDQNFDDVEQAKLYLAEAQAVVTSTTDEEEEPAATSSSGSSQQSDEEAPDQTSETNSQTTTTAPN